MSAFRFEETGRLCGVVTSSSPACMDDEAWKQRRRRGMGVAVPTPACNHLPRSRACQDSSACHLCNGYSNNRRSVNLGAAERLAILRDAACSLAHTEKDNALHASLPPTGLSATKSPSRAKHAPSDC
eukprot:3173196-Pleurochrysis_carterae.AAC.1